MDSRSQLKPSTDFSRVWTGFQSRPCRRKRRRRLAQTIPVMAWLSTDKGARVENSYDYDTFSVFVLLLYLNFNILGLEKGPDKPTPREITVLLWWRRRRGSYESTFSNPQHLRILR
jgi:hypothetical protein